MKKNRRPSSRGFTLIEIAAFAAFVGFLAFTAMQAVFLSQARDRAGSALRSAGMDVSRALFENGGHSRAPLALGARAREIASPVAFGEMVKAWSLHAAPAPTNAPAWALAVFEDEGRAVRDELAKRGVDLAALADLQAQLSEPLPQLTREQKRALASICSLDASRRLGAIVEKSRGQLLSGLLASSGVSARDLEAAHVKKHNANL